MKYDGDCQYPSKSGKGTSFIPLFLKFQLDMDLAVNAKINQEDADIPQI